MENFSSYRAHKVKLLTEKVKNRNKSAILIFFFILFFVHVAVILKFFFKLYTSVTFIPSPLSCYNKSYYRQHIK